MTTKLLNTYLNNNDHLRFHCIWTFYCCCCCYNWLRSVNSQQPHRFLSVQCRDSVHCAPFPLFSIAVRTKKRFILVENWISSKLSNSAYSVFSIQCIVHCIVWHITQKFFIVFIKLLFYCSSLVHSWLNVDRTV